MAACGYNGFVLASDSKEAVAMIKRSGRCTTTDGRFRCVGYLSLAKFVGKIRSARRE